MIKIKNLSKIYDGFYALDNISFSVNEGDIYGIIGLSGAGKSTLLKCITLLEKADSGNIFIQDEDITKMNKAQLFKMRSSMGVVFQGYNLLEQKNVYDNIAFPLRIRKEPEQYIKKRVNELLKLVSLEDKINAYPSKLSGGQKQRVAIARALATKPSILLLDELTSALDPITTNQILSLLKKINQEEKVTMLLITHEIKVVQLLCNKVAVLNGGKVVESGCKNHVLENPQNGFTKILLNKEVEL